MGWNKSLFLVVVGLSTALMTGLRPACGDPSGGPPTFPATFDKDTVDGLVRAIDAGQNAVILRVGYFGGHRVVDYDRQSGYNDLVAQMGREQPGTDRWLLLQSVRAYGALHLGTANQAEGYKAYDAIFQSATGVLTGKAPFIVDRALYDFSNMAFGHFGPAGNGVDP